MSAFDPVVLEGFSKNSLRIHVGEGVLLLAEEQGMKSIKAFVYSKNKPFDIPGDKITDKKQLKAYFRNDGLLSTIEIASNLEENIRNASLLFSELEAGLEGKDVSLGTIKPLFENKVTVNNKIPAYDCLCDYIDNGLIKLGD